MVRTNTGTWAMRMIWGTFALAAVGTAIFSMRWVLWIGPLAPGIRENPFVLPWMPIHAAGAGLALLLGAFQFLPSVRARIPWAHRFIGRAYVLACLAGGVSGFLLAFGSTAGPTVTAGFGTLALFWIYATLKAWQLAMQRRFAEHRAWMIRSWAMTFAAVTLRIYLPLIPYTGMTFLEGYRFISIACWTFNLAVAEVYLRVRAQ